jgi:hypothetical protein
MIQFVHATPRHDIAEILLMLALNTNQSINHKNNGGKNFVQYIDKVA